MRHGQASFGSEVYDSLTPLGIEQAQNSATWVRNRAPFFKVWHGPRQRHIQTARESLSLIEHPIELQASQNLDEFSEGEEILHAASNYFERDLMNSKEFAREDQLHYYEKAIQAWCAGQLDLPGRDTFEVFRSTVNDWLTERIEDPNSPSGRAELAITSAGVICMVMCEVLDLPDHKWLEFMRVIKNCSFTELVFSKGRCSIKSFNEAGHLAEKLSSSI